MSDILPPNSPPPPPDQSGARGNCAPSWRMQRRASVTLRRDSETEESGSLMDPATKSLSDALRITYRFVLLAVVALGVFYALSGFRRVYEGERGIRLLFGRVMTDDVQPGFRFSVPEPFGELVKVRTGAQTLAIEDDFFPQLTEEEKKQVKDNGVGVLAGGGFGKLNPEVDGSVITGDGNLAHTRWAVTYSREDPKLVAENIDPEFERAMVLAACKRGIVRAVASVSIDELLKNTPDPGRGAEWRTVENRAREVAQQTLDAMKSGIEIDILSLTAKIAPRRVMPSFNAVQASKSEQQQMKDEANTHRTNTLVAVAGEAATPILEQIAAYEKALELKDEAAAVAIMERIDKLMQGEKVTIDGKEMNPIVYGEVKTLISDAQRERRSYVAALQGEVDRFKAKLESYRANPMVLLNSEWADAYATLMARPYVQSMFLPELDANGRYVLNFGTDAEIAKRIQQAYSKEKAEEAERIRRQIQERARNESNIESTKAVATD